MSRKLKRTLSLVLALIMLCSTVAFISAAAVSDPITRTCEKCRTEQTFYYSHYDDSLNRIVECPTHGTHDAEERYQGHFYYCSVCGQFLFIRTAIVYVCLD